MPDRDAHRFRPPLRLKRSFALSTAVVSICFCLQVPARAQQTESTAPSPEVETPTPGEEVETISPVPQLEIKTPAQPAETTSAPSAKPEPAAEDKWELPHYDKGFVLVASPKSAAVPFRLKLNHVSQFKYSNSLAVDRTYTDHFGNVKEVVRRNDIELTRDVFYFSG